MESDQLEDIAMVADSEQFLELQEEGRLSPTEEVEEEEEEMVTKVVVQKKDDTETKFVLDDHQVDKLYDTLRIPVDEPNKKFKTWRLDVVHIRGVKEMSSEDVLEYFNEFDPISIEWVNDLSCNIVFEEERSAASAVVGLSQAVVIKGKDNDEDMEVGDLPTVEADTLAVPIPPGHWLLGKTHPKSKALLIRLANTSDKKMKGPSKSDDIREERNPRPAGVKGLISDTLIKQVRKRVNVDSGDGDEQSEARSSKLMRMRMRADDEEERIKAKSTRTMEPLFGARRFDNRGADRDEGQKPKRSVWERLDTNYRSEASHRPYRAPVSPKVRPTKKKSVWSRLSTPSEREEADEKRTGPKSLVVRKPYDDTKNPF
jgi:hypothetical protein